MTFYLKYRSKTIDELDLKEVRESLGKIINSGSIPHALLFSGPKGSGKTSAARILSKIINCEDLGKNGEPCGKCDQCISIAKGTNIDVVEIDAASHRGIDDIRSLREAVKLAPARAKKKVYIIDEAHMLTTEASNALLKTLEEPPEHVIFILATTNPEKLIETIRSRVVTIPFRKASNEEIARSLSRVIQGENLKVEDNTLILIAKASEGSFRDAVKTLEQLAQEDKLSHDEVENFLFSKKSFDPDKFIGLLIKKDEKGAFLAIEKAVSDGVPVKTLTTLLLGRLRLALLAKVDVGDADITDLSKEDVLTLLKLIGKSASEIPFAVLEQIPLELAVAEWCFNKNKDQKLKIKDPVGKNERESSLKGINKKDGHAEPSPESQNSKNGDSKEIKSDEFSLNIWTQVLTQIRSKNTSTEALLRASQPIGFDGKTLTLGVYYKFHKERLESNPHREILAKMLEETIGDSVRVVCTLTEPPVKIQKEEKIVLAEGEDEDIIKVAKEIFGN